MDGLSQASLEHEVSTRLTDRYWRWFSWSAIWLEVQIWSQANRHYYSYDSNSERQNRDMYAAVAAELERQKAKQVGYKVEDLHYYTIPHLKELVAQVCAGTHSTRLDEAYADVQKGLYSMVNEGSRNQILNYHAGEMVSEEAYEQALGKLQEVLGGQRPKGLK